MNESSIYRDIAKRTGGDIYIGVVGPVRTGKSTFIQKFLDSAVIPKIENEFDRERTLDQMPQSATGKTIMTTEPKFVPDESVKIDNGDGTEFNVKMIDCVGYMVDGALGAEEEGTTRMVNTPWSEEPMPFPEAAELGTSKVIGEHSTIAMLVTTDGSISDIPRESYIPAEERVVKELREFGKPFAIILNSANPESEEAHRLAEELEKKYDAPVALVACTRINSDDIKEILDLVLGEFPIKALTFRLPAWTEALADSHELRVKIIDTIKDFADGAQRFMDIDKKLEEHPDFVRISTNAGDGVCELEFPLDKDVYYSTLSDITGLNIENEKQLFETVQALAQMKKKYRKVEAALLDVEEKGYGIVMPSAEDLKIEEPKLTKQAGGYGVKVTAHADSIHMIKTQINADLCPVVGSEEQSAEVVKHLCEEYEESPDKVLEYNMFGRSLLDMVNDSMNQKLSHMPDDSREKLGDTLGKIINEGSSGLICILL